MTSFDDQDSTSAELADFIVVSNRLPVDRQTEDDGTVTWKPSPGGLVTALEPVIRKHGGAWVGWPGVKDVEAAPFVENGMQLVPVTLTDDDIAEYYEGFSNDTLWPLYHDVIAEPSFHRDWWQRYVKINQRFADAVIAAAAQGATVWVQDYQLQLVPQMLRRARPDLLIGFFLHIPFPPQNLFAQLPWRKQIIEGLLGADVVGFQRAQDAVHFASCVKRVLGLRTRKQTIEVATGPAAADGIVPRRRIIARHYPISIDAASFEAMARRPEVLRRAEAIKEDLGNPATLILGVDRLDYTKGITHRIKAFGELLDDGDLSVDDAALVQVASPSRERVYTYQQLRDDIELAVGRINGNHSTISRSAITYLHHGYPREEMVALYLAADILLVTALRDGMNLVAKEYLASRHDNDGVLVLSEFTGAADEMPQAVLVNPHDIEGLKESILGATRMPEPERRRRMKQLRKRVFEFDVAAWSKAFLADLETAHESSVRHERSEEREAVGGTSG